MARNAEPANTPQVNLITAGTTFEGTIHTKSDIRISGTIKGALHASGKAIVASEGLVDGNLHADDADVAGSVKGDLRIKGRLVLKSSAKVEGTIHVSRLIVEEGASFDGQCVMGQLDEKRAASLQSKAPNGAGATSPERIAASRLG